MRRILPLFSLLSSQVRHQKHLGLLQEPCYGNVSIVRYDFQESDDFDDFGVPGFMRKSVVVSVNQSVKRQVQDLTNPL